MFARDRQSLPFVEQWQKAYDSNTDADEVMDLFYALFQHIFSMRDWLLNSNVDGVKVSTLFSANRLQLCRDISKRDEALHA